MLCCSKEKEKGQPLHKVDAVVVIWIGNIGCPVCLDCYRDHQHRGKTQRLPLRVVRG